MTHRDEGPQHWLGSNNPRMSLLHVAQMPRPELRRHVDSISPTEFDRLLADLQIAMDHCGHFAFQGAQRAWDMIAERRAQMMAEPFPQARQEVTAMKTADDEATQRFLASRRERAIAQERGKLHAQLLPVAAQILGGMAASRPNGCSRYDVLEACNLAMMLSREMLDGCHAEAERLIVLLEEDRRARREAKTDE